MGGDPVPNPSRARCRTLFLVADTLIVAAVMAGHPAHATSAFFGLGQFPGGTQSFASSVSDDGSVVVGGGSRTPPPNREPFRWTSATGLIGLGSLGGPNGGSASDVSADGSVAVGSVDRPVGGGRAFRWTSTSGMVELPDLPSDGSDGTTAAAVSADGSTVVGYGAISLGQEPGVEAYRWTQATGGVGIGFLPDGTESQAFGVSGDGSVVVGWSYALSEELTLEYAEAFLWTQGAGMLGLGELLGAGSYSVAYDVTPDGSVVVGALASPIAGPREPFRWTAQGGMVGLGNLPDGSYDDAEAYGVSADGSVIVGRGFDGARPRSFIWDAGHGMRALEEVLVDEYGLDLGGWSSLLVAAISADGRTLVGSGVNPDRGNEAWVAVLDHSVPEPATGLLVSLGLVALVARVYARPGTEQRTERDSADH
jgi:probable HAF family extracellular repeat protein